MIAQKLWRKKNKLDYVANKTKAYFENYRNICI